MNSLTPVLPAEAVVVFSLLCAFVLRVTAGYGLAWIVARFSRSASVRFAIWLAFLVGSACYWALTLRTMLLAGMTARPVSAPLGASLSGSPVLLSNPLATTLGEALTIAGVAYGCVLLGFSAAGIWRRIGLIRALRERYLPEAPLSRAMEQIAAQLGSPPCRLWVLDRLPSPASVGWVRPAIYLPADEAMNPGSDLNDILRHELCHIRRRDGLWELLSRVARSALFFHPLVHRAFSTLRLERELACDLLVVRNNPEHRHLYADTLVRFGWRTSLAYQQDHIGIGFTSQAAVLNRRVRSILQGERLSSRRSRAARVMLGAGTCWMAASVLPVLCIVFGLARATPPGLGDAVFATSSSVRGRPVRRAAPRRPSVAQATSAALPASAPALTVGASHEIRPTLHMLPDASAPMSDNGPADPDLSGSAEADPRRQAVPPRAALPSGTSVLLNSEAAIAALGRMHGDHGKDD